MSIHLQRDIENLNDRVLVLSQRVEEMIDKAIRALLERRTDFAEQVLRGDDDIDRREVAIEEECLKILALHQPVAIDLRRVAAVIKINTDLERIADLAVNIAERTMFLSTQADFPIPPRLRQMTHRAVTMVTKALNAFVKLDVTSAREIGILEEEVNADNREVIHTLQLLMRQSPDMIPAAMHCFSTSKHLERIADHATNIAEDVLYLVEGEIARHRRNASDSSLSSR